MVVVVVVVVVVAIAPPPHSKKGPDWMPEDGRSFCVGFTRSPHGAVGSLWVPSGFSVFLPQSKDMQLRLIGEKSVNEVDCCL